MSNREDLLNSYKAGNFLETLYACSLGDQSGRNALISELVALHNDGLIDVVEAFKSLKKKSKNGPDFFLTRHIFEKALPDLNAPVHTTMHCVNQLFHDAGQDMAAGSIIDSFVVFCGKDPARPQEALKEIELNPIELSALLPAALIAGSKIDHTSYLNKAITLSEDEDIELRRQAVFSIGKLDLPDGCGEHDLALSCLERIFAKETDDQILASVIKSSFWLLRREESLETGVVNLFNLILSKGVDYTYHAASEIFGFHTAKIPEDLLDSLLVHLKNINPSNKGTLDNIDYGISHLLKKGNHKKAITFMEAILRSHSGELTMEAFGGSAREVLSNREIINKILTRWFLSGDRDLCEGIYQIIGTQPDADIPLEIDTSELKDTNNNILFIFLARKAIGFLFSQPVSATSILISLMRNTTDEETLKGLGSLLFDPMLINYTGKVRDYALKQSEQESGKVKATIDQALHDVEQYLEDLRSPNNLAALHPSESHREAYHRYFSAIMTKSWKEAEGKSVFLGLISKSVLLYGRKSISYVHTHDGQSQRMETPLQKHGTEIEFPRTEVIDPYGLDYMFRIFRNERLKT